MSRSNAEIIQAAIEGFETRKQRLNERIGELRGMLSGASSESPSASPSNGRRTMSPAARKRIAEAQRKRWAAVKNPHGNVEFLGESKILVHDEIAGRETFVLQPDFAHNLDSVVGKTLSQLIQRNGLRAAYPFLKTGAGIMRLGAASFYFSTLLGYRRPRLLPSAAPFQPGSLSCIGHWPSFRSSPWIFGAAQCVASPDPHCVIASC